MKRIALLSLSIILMISSCRDPEYIPLAQEIKDYVMFQPGSYWIYEDTISGALDCLVYKNISTERIEPGNENIAYNNFYVDYEVWYDDSVFRYGLYINGNPNISGVGIDIGENTYYYFNYPIGPDDKQLNDSIRKIYNGEIENTGDTVYAIWQKNVGLIECDFRIRENKIWKLKRYDVQQ